MASSADMNTLEQSEDLGIKKTKLSDFYDHLRYSLCEVIMSYNDPSINLKMARKPIAVIGKPGIGKTAGIQSIVDELNTVLSEDCKIGLVKILLGQQPVGRLSGIPLAVKDDNTGKTVIQSVQAAELPDEKRDGKFGVLFLDEVTTADQAQVLPALGLCDDTRNLGQYTLPEHWIVVLAGNGPDCANFQFFDDALMSRCTVFDIAYNYMDDWYLWARANGIHNDILAYLSSNSDEVAMTRSTEDDNAGKAFPCPRSWEALSHQLDVIDSMEKSRGKSVDDPSLYKDTVPENLAIAKYQQKKLKKSTSDAYREGSTKYDRYLAKANGIIGVKSSNSFYAFCLLHEKLKYDPDKILAGTEKQPDRGALKADDVQGWHLISSACVDKLYQRIQKETIEDMGTGVSGGKICSASDELIDALGNIVTWFATLPLTISISLLSELRGVDGFKLMFTDSRLAKKPTIRKYIMDNNKELVDAGVLEYIAGGR